MKASVHCFVLYLKDGPPQWLDGNLCAMQEAQVQCPGQEDPLVEEMATHSSTLAWRIPWTEEPGGLQSTVSQRVRHDYSNLAAGAALFKRQIVVNPFCWKQCSIMEHLEVSLTQHLEALVLNSVSTTN